VAGRAGGPASDRDIFFIKLTMQIIVLEDGQRFWVDLVADRGCCRYCRREVFWGYFENGEFCPIEKNEHGYVTHFIRCPKMHRRYNAEYQPRTNGVDNDGTVRYANARR